MPYEAMLEVKALIDANYVTDKICGRTYHAAIAALHAAYAESNGLERCRCLSCNR